MHSRNARSAAADDHGQVSSDSREVREQPFRMIFQAECCESGKQEARNCLRGTLVQGHSLRCRPCHPVNLAPSRGEVGRAALSAWNVCFRKKVE